MNIFVVFVILIIFAVLVLVGGLIYEFNYALPEHQAYCAHYGWTYMDMGRFWVCIDPPTHQLYR